MIRVGLTGGIGSGKSTVAGVLARLGATVIDSDVLAREVVAPGTPGLAAVADLLGSEVLASDGSLDRAAVAAIVFADPDKRRQLEAIVHPLVRRRAAQIEAGAPVGGVVVHDIPLLVETNQAQSFDAVIVVDIPDAVQVSRLESRGMSTDEARRRISAQASRDARRAVATYLIDNTGTIDALEDKVADVWRQLTR